MKLKVVWMITWPGVGTGDGDWVTTNSNINTNSVKLEQVDGGTGSGMIKSVDLLALVLVCRGL